MSTDPREIISKEPMSWMQVMVVAITIALNALDGFDVLSISFASPGIAAEWGIDRAALGWVLSAELFGMAIGSMYLGGVADKIGRRPTMLGCLIVMALGMFMVTTSTGFLGGLLTPVLALFGANVDDRLADLAIWRVVTGLGIGGMLAAINAVAAEFSNTRRRDLSVSIMSIGYPVGAVLGGLVTAQLLESYDWRAVFYFGTAVTVAMLPVVYLLVPESVHWLTQKQPAGALEKINHTLVRMRHSAVAALPVLSAEVRARTAGDIFKPALLRTTLLVTAAYFFHITTFYYILKWVPKIVVDMGFEAASAAGVLVWVNVGGATGGAVVGLLTQRYGVKGITIGVMVMSTVMVTLFGRTDPDLAQLSLICAASGFFTNGAITGMYAIFAKAFPTHARAFGTGIAIGVGRGGSLLAPIVAGYLFTWNLGLPAVSFMMALGSLCAAGVLLMLRLTPDKPIAEGTTREEIPGDLKGAAAHSR